MLIADGVKYILYVPKDEKEFEALVKEHLPEVFGPNLLYFDIKPELRSKAGVGSKPDGIAILLDEPCVYVVEFELSGHPIHDHIVAQISRFNKALKSSDTRLTIAEAIYSEVLAEPYKKIFVESKVKNELFKFLTELFSSKPKIAIIVDEITEELSEAVEDLPFETRIIEFKTFTREGVGLAVHAHLFEPIQVSPPPSSPPPRATWDEKLKLASDNVRELVKVLTNRIVSELRDVIQQPIGDDYQFFREKKTSRNRFAVLMLRKNWVSIRIRADPKTFKDERNWTEGKVYKGWFFTHGVGQEREFKIDGIEQLDYAMELIRQSFTISA